MSDQAKKSKNFPSGSKLKKFSEFQRPNSERNSIMPSAVKFSFKTGLQICLSGNQTGFHASNQRSCFL
jgi:hypothetical protein